MGKGFFTAAALFSVAFAKQQRRDPNDRPNIIMLFVDDLGYGDVGFTGHPTTVTPNIDQLAYNGKILTQWYSGCPVCSGSRGALMTGRQYTRIGIPGVFSPTGNTGLPLNETTVAAFLKSEASYATGIMGKWHLGNRHVYMPANHGFDEYLGIPYSDDMGEARRSACNASLGLTADGLVEQRFPRDDGWLQYVQAGFTDSSGKGNDPAGDFLPLVHQTKQGLNYTVLEQPLDFTFLAGKYKSFIKDFVTKHEHEPFFLYMPFSHVHTTAANQPEKQYAGCSAQNSTTRGKFGDALKEVDDQIGSLMQTLGSLELLENTLIVFTGDNGPWMVQNQSAGSTGIFYGRNSGYWNVGKGSTWEGGIHEAAFAYWKGKIEPGSRSTETISSLDLLPTVASILGLSLPTDRVFDGRDASDIILTPDGKSKHQALFFYGSCGDSKRQPSAMRWGPYKAHFCTNPGLSGCDGCEVVFYPPGAPLLFNVLEDPSEAYPLTAGNFQNYTEVVQDIKQRFDLEKASFWWGTLIPEPDQPGEGPNLYGVCCNRTENCDCDGKPSDGPNGVLN